MLAAAMLLISVGYFVVQRYFTRNQDDLAKKSKLGDFKFPRAEEADAAIGPAAKAFRGYVAKRAADDGVSYERALAAIGDDAVASLLYDAAEAERRAAAAR